MLNIKNKHQTVWPNSWKANNQTQPQLEVLSNVSLRKKFEVEATYSCFDIVATVDMLTDRWTSSLHKPELLNYIVGRNNG